MRDLWVSLPLILPLATAIACLLARRYLRVQRVISVLGGSALLVASGGLLLSLWPQSIRVVQVGGWPAPFGISLVADLLSALMVVLAGVSGFATLLFGIGSLEPRLERYFHPLLPLLLLGVNGTCLAGDLFNLYVWFEVMLMASFVLLALGVTRAQLEGAMKYLTLNLLGSAMLLSAIGLVYGTTGTLNMADLSLRLAESPAPGLITTLAMLFVVAAGLKAAVFPLFFWLPASYHTPPVAVGALFAGLLTKVGIYVLVRLFTLLFTRDTAAFQQLFLWTAGFTMVTGVLGAVAQNEMRRLLSFHIVSQVGYLLMGLALFTPAGLAGVVFFLAHIVIAKTALFLVSGIAQRLKGTYRLDRLGDLYRDEPWLAVLFFIPAMSLAGIPPLSGFFAKLALIRAGLAAEQYVLVAVALAVSLLTLFSMVKIWDQAFLKPAPGLSVPPPRPVGVLLVGPLVALVGLTVLLGLGAEPLMQLSVRAAAQLGDPALYVAAVLGGRP